MRARATPIAGNTATLANGGKGSDVNAKPGNPYPLGATWDARGVKSLFSEHASVAERCPIDELRRLNDDFLLRVNTHRPPIDFSLPFEKDGDWRWQRRGATANDQAEEQRLGSDKTALAAASLKLLARRHRV